MNRPNPVKSSNSLENSITNAKDMSVVTLWWLSVPGFLALMLMMKSTYMADDSFINSLHDLLGREKYVSLVFFVISPAILMMVNGIIIFRIHALSGNPNFVNTLVVAWFNVTALIFCITILLINTL